MSEDNVVSFSLELNIEHCEIELRKVLTLLNRTLFIVKKLSGGNEDLNQLIGTLQRTIMVVNQLRLAILAIQAASGPIGWALAGVGIISSLLITGEFVGDLTYDSRRGR